MKTAAREGKPGRSIIFAKGMYELLTETMIFSGWESQGIKVRLPTNTFAHTVTTYNNFCLRFPTNSSVHIITIHTCIDGLMFQLRNKTEAQSERCLPSWNFCAVFRCRSSTVSTVSAHSRTSLRPNKWVDWHRASKARCTQTGKWCHSLTVSTQNLGDILISFTCWVGGV